MSTPLIHSATTTPVSCPPRNIYIDMGVNWCNTLELWKQVAAKVSNAPFSPDPWLVFGWEAAPLIAPYAERCMAHLNAGQPLPDPVVPPTGSSAELYQWVTSRPKAQPSLFACYQQNTRDFEKTKHCIFEALRDNLTAVRPDPELSQNEALLQRRLGMARRCAPRAARTASAHYVLVPAAAGAREGNMTMYGGIEQMMLGGIKPTPSGVFTSRHEHALRTRVRRVDAVQWLLDSVREEDYVVLKLDVEGMPAAVCTIRPSIPPRTAHLPVPAATSQHL